MPETSAAPVKTPTKRATLKRLVILDAAVRSFSAAGYERTSVDAVAAEAGVGKQTVYSYFGTKEGLFLETIAHARELAKAQHGAIDVDPEFPGTGLTVLARACLSAVLDPAVAALRRLTIGELPHHVALQKLWRESSAPPYPYPQIANFLAESDRRGSLTVSDPERSARQFVYLLATEGRTSTAQGLQPLPESECSRIIAETVDLFMRAHLPT